jgi:hypothetical protein
MINIKDFPKDYDGFYFLPPEKDDEVGFTYQFFRFKDEMKNAKPIETTPMGDKFHIVFFKRNEEGTAEFHDSFEAIFSCPLTYVNNLMGTKIYGCVCRKTDKSEKWFEEYLIRTSKNDMMNKMLRALRSILSQK